MRVGVVITNYETWELTGRALGALAAFHQELADCVVVDDASRSGPNETLPPWARVLRNPVNLGLVRSLNLGLAALAADIAVIFDSDAYPLQDFVAAVRRRFETDQRLGVLGFRTVDRYGNATGCSEPEPGLSSLLAGQRLHALLPGPVGGNLCVYTCAMAVRRATWEQLAGFDERFDWLDLDLDLCARAWRAGWRVEQSRELTAHHEGAGAPQKTSARVQRFYRNRWLLLRKLGKLRHPRLVRAALSLRLAGELVGLLLVGRLLVRGAGSWRDKVEGRKALLRWALADAASVLEGASGTPT